MTNVIFTKHALSRLSERSLTKDQIVEVINSPQLTKPIAQTQTTKFIKTINDRRIHVVASLSSEKKWLVISVWVRGEEDKLPIVWQLLTLPFRLFWKLIQFVFAQILPKVF